MNVLHVIGAIVLLSITMLNTQRHQMELRQQQIRSEVEMRATGVATRLLDHLSTLPFDPNADTHDPSMLTPASGFGGAQSFEAARYVHDVHGLSFVTSAASNGGPLDFEVSVGVQYVRRENGTFQPSPTQTFYKEVTLEVTSQAGAQFTVRRVYTPHS